MSLTKVALAFLLYANVCLIARGQTLTEGVYDCLSIADIALVVDVSGSIEGDGRFPGKFDQYIKPFVKNFVMDLDVGPGKVQVGMVTFGNEGTLEFPLLSNINDINRNIDLFDYSSRGKNTNTSGGLYVMRTQLLSPKDPNYRPRATHIAVVVTDGKATRDVELTIPYAKEAQDDKIIILCVGVTQELNIIELTRIASPLTPFNITSLEAGYANGVFTSSGTVAYVPEIVDLIKVVHELVAYFRKTVCGATKNCPSGDMADWCGTGGMNSCSNDTIKKTCCITCPTPLPGECPSGDTADLCKTIELSSCSQQEIKTVCCSTCQTQRPVCNDYVDLSFVADVSGSIGKDRNDPEYFDREVKPFFKGFVQSLNVGPGKIQVGMVTFGNRGYFQFPLSSDVNAILRGIDNVVYPPYGDNTNTSGGIYVMRTQVLGANSPNFRPDALHIAIVVTDGKSTYDHENTIPFATDAKNQGIKIFAIGCTPDINPVELAAIASNMPGFNFNMIRDAIQANTTGISGSVAYSPSIEYLKYIVQDLTNYISNVYCKQPSNQATALTACMNAASWCASMFPGQCYDSMNEKNCCKFCSEHRASDPNCLYGDKYSWCAPDSCAAASKDCCQTCSSINC